ncbi:MAG: hypothetical protein ABI830_06485 [Pseudolabrys sp.]
MYFAPRNNSLTFAGALVGIIVLCTSCGSLALAQEINTAMSRGLLVSAETAQGTAPTQIKLDFAKTLIPSRAQLELEVEPVSVSNERYIVVVSASGKGEKQIGSFSFFPPARKGEVQKFLVDAQPLLAEMKTKDASQFELSVQLVPVNSDNKLSNSALRILGARLVGG